LNFCINCGHKDISQDVINSPMADVLYKERLIKMDALNVIIAGISFF